MSSRRSLAPFLYPDSWLSPSFVLYISECRFLCCICLFSLTLLLLSPFCRSCSPRWGHLLPMYCCYFAILSKFHSCMSSEPFPYLMMMYIAQWLVYFCCLSLSFLTLWIVTLLILDRACLSYATSSKPSLKKALNKACAQYITSPIHGIITKQFSASPRAYSTSQFTEFVLQHRLR